MRKRVPGYITQETDRNFGIEVRVQRQINPKTTPFSPSGDPVPEGQFPDGNNFASDRRYREVIPPGEIGSDAGEDLDILTPPQFIDTVQHYAGEQNDPHYHGAVLQERQAEKTTMPLQNYAKFQPRTAPMPRSCADDTYLEGPGKNSADQLMKQTRDSSNLMPDARDRDVRDLYGPNRSGFLVEGDYGHTESNKSAIGPSTSKQD